MTFLNLCRMFKNWKNRRLVRKLSSIGSRVDSSFMLYVNSDAPVQFAEKSSLIQYLSDYRCTNTIYKLSIYRVDTYSL